MSGGNSLEAVHQFGDYNLEWTLNQEVNMIFLAIELHELGFEVIAYIREDGPHLIEDLACE